MRLEFHANGTPKGQPRPKAFVRGQHAGVYDPGTAEGWKDSIRWAAKQAWDKRPFEGPLNVGVEFLFPRPKQHWIGGRVGETLKANAPVWHTSRPDIDNCLKAVFDALTTIGVYADDSQIVNIHSTKRYAGNLIALEELPGALVVITTTRTT